MIKYLVISLAAISILASTAYSADTTAIDTVRAKAAFTDADGAIIDQYVASVTREMLERSDFGNVGVTTEAFARAINPATPNPKYTEYLTAAVLKHFKPALDEADKVNDADRRTAIKLNLLIMLEKVGQFRTAVLAAPSFGDIDAAVRYWAVKCVSNQAVITQLNSGSPDATRAATEIIASLKAALPQESNPTILAMASDFAGDVSATESADLAVAVAAKRMKQYEDWTVTQTIVDGRVLEALGKKVKTSKAAASAYGQLLSDCMQRFAKYMASPSIMSEQEKTYLGTTLSTVEKGSLSTLLGPGRQNLQNAVARDTQGLTAMNGEYTLLFGTAAAPGELTKVTGAKYPDAQGKEQTLPHPLPDKPGTTKK
jgi:hypothetical protein